MVKRVFDFGFALMALVIFSWLLLLSWLLSALTTGENGFFLQKRVGQHGKLFSIIKIRTMKDGQVTALGGFFRKYKIDELPQLINILKGDMSFVGPRPDIPGYYDQLEGEELKVLELKPGLTSEASLKYYDEEFLLRLQDDPLEYNDRIIFPDKVRMSLDYYHNNSFVGDLIIIFKTVFRKFS